MEAFRRWDLDGDGVLGAADLCSWHGFGGVPASNGQSTGKVDAPDEDINATLAALGLDPRASGARGKVVHYEMTGDDACIASHSKPVVKFGSVGMLLSAWLELVCGGDDSSTREILIQAQVLSVAASGTGHPSSLETSPGRAESWDPMPGATVCFLSDLTANLNGVSQLTDVPPPQDPMGASNAESELFFRSGAPAAHKLSAEAVEGSNAHGQSGFEAQSCQPPDGDHSSPGAGSDSHQSGPDARQYAAMLLHHTSEVV